MGVLPLLLALIKCCKGPYLVPHPLRAAIIGTLGTSGVWVYLWCEQGHGTLSSSVGLTHPMYIVNVNACSFQGVACSLQLVPVPVYLYMCIGLIVCLHACYNLIMYHWCCTCLWQTLVPSCVNTCTHLNKPEFQPLSQILFVCGTLGSWSPL